MGNRIKALLKRAGKTQAELAAAVRMTTAGVSRTCSGISAPSPETARLIARFFDVDVESLGLRAQRRTGPRSISGRIDRSAFEHALKRKDLTAAELARRAVITRQTVSAYLAGRALPKAATLRRLARLLDVEPDQLLVDAPPARTASAKRRD